MKKVTGVLFDKDGTLVNFNQTWGPTYQAAAYSLSGEDHKLAKQMLRDAGLKKDGLSFVSGSVLAAGTNGEIAEFWHRYLPTYSQDTLLTALNNLLESGALTNLMEITNTENFFNRLSARALKLGVATNDSETSAIQTMDNLLGAAQVDFIAGCDSGYGGKPEPGMFIAFCETLDLNPSEVIVVGDNPYDMEMGRLGGAGHLVGVLSGNSDFNDLSGKADHIIQDVTFLEKLLDDKIV
jgi:phosphoglycolate phosphatase